MGEMYICNTLSHSIEKYNFFNESVSTIVENLNFPQNIALDQSGNIFITDSFSKSIKKFDIKTQTISYRYFRT